MTEMINVEIRLHNETSYNAQCTSLRLTKGDWIKQLAQVIETNATNEGKAEGIAVEGDPAFVIKFVGVEGDVRATFIFGAGKATIFDAESSIRKREVKKVHSHNRHGNTLHCALMMYEPSRLMSVNLHQKYFAVDMDWRVKEHIELVKLAIQNEGMATDWIQQEHIEPAKEHVTRDREIQTWLPDTNFSNLQIWKGSNVRMHTCVRRVPQHSLRVNRGFDPIQQQPSYCSRQQRATHPRVPFFWTEKHFDLLGGNLGASVRIRSFAVLSLEAIHRFLLRVPFP